MESKGPFNWKDMFQIDEQLQEIDFNSNRPTNSNKSRFEDGGWGPTPPAFLLLTVCFSLSEYLNLSEYFGT